jgi:crotonobetainyl-CoA:carnitine CoA-transferase CaiB-like acyl-CoA transferase
MAKELSVSGTAITDVIGPVIVIIVVNLQPITGIRVVDLTRVLSGPFSTMLLADMGADVVKIETPQGDTVRGQGEVVNGLSWYFASVNRNKRSVVLDLRKDEAKAVLAPTCSSRTFGPAF